VRLGTERRNAIHLNRGKRRRWRVIITIGRVPSADDDLKQTEYAVYHHRQITENVDRNLIDERGPRPNRIQNACLQRVFPLTLSHPPSPSHECANNTRRFRGALALRPPPPPGTSSDMPRVPGAPARYPYTLIRVSVTVRIGRAV